MRHELVRLFQLNTHDIGGGAAKVAWDLFTAYRARGHKSWLVVGEKKSSDPDVLVLPNDQHAGRSPRSWKQLSSTLRCQKNGGRTAQFLGSLARGMAGAARSLDRRLGLEDFQYPGARHLLSLVEQPPAIIHGHNLHGNYFDLRVLPSLSRRVPVVLTLHDAWMLSGHCAHSLGCERWRIGCGHCPDLTLYPSLARDATAQNWLRKRGIFSRSRLYIATPSRGLMRMVEESMLATGVVEGRIVPNGVDLSIFYPCMKSTSRMALGIPPDTRVVLFVADGIRDNIWKDYMSVREAAAMVAERLRGEAVLFLALGEDAPPERVGQAEIRFVPYQTNSAVVADYYRAADVYVHAARADTFPLSVLEALACGTPVVATAVGGIPEQVEDSQTGFLVSVGEAKELAYRITQLLSDNDLRQRMGIHASCTARQRFDLRRQVDAYLSWYSELEEGKARGRFRKSSTEMDGQPIMGPNTVR